MEKEWTVDDVISLLEVNKFSIQGHVEMFGLVDKGIGNRNVVGASFPLCEGSFEGVGYVGVMHKLHETSIKDTGQHLPKAASGGYGSVVSRILFRPLLMECCTVCHFPTFREV